MKKSRIIRLTAILLAVLLVLPYNSALAYDGQTRESKYIDSFYYYLYEIGGGQFELYFGITATDRMDSIGCQSAVIYESVNGTDWYEVSRYSANSLFSSIMMGSNVQVFSGKLTYYGIAGRYYKAYICLYAGKNGGGDSRYRWTNVVQP